MKKHNKVFIKSFLMSGLVYSGLMAGSNYHAGEDFNLWKFLFHFTFFGLSMGLLSLYKYKKKSNQEKHK